jgi:hypothetical protein
MYFVIDWEMRMFTEDELVEYANEMRADFEEEAAGKRKNYHMDLEDSIDFIRNNCEAIYKGEKL